jgi:predicted porin
MKKTLVAAAAMAVTALSAQAAEFKAGDWTVNVGGNINAFYTTSDCKDPLGTVAGIALGDSGFACGATAANPASQSTVIGNGLLPSQLSAGAKSTQNGYDISANVTISVATATNSSLAQNQAVDVRNAFMTIGNAGMGTFKLGRDYGLFGLNAVLGDMTLLGVGAATAATQNGRVSLGHLGAGMAYVGTYGQMVYSTPSASGMSLDIGAFSPVNTTLGAGQVASDGPQVQARLNFGSGNFKAWLATKNQQFAKGTAPAGFSMSATEVGASTSLGGLNLVANFQSGKGLGVLSDGDQGDVKTQHTFVQGTYTVAPKTRVGLGYGKSENDTNIGAANNLKSNENTTFGLYYNITPQVTLVGEVGETTSKAFNGAQAKQKSIAFGGIFFF